MTSKNKLLSIVLIILLTSCTVCIPHSTNPVHQCTNTDTDDTQEYIPEYTDTDTDQ